MLEILCDCHPEYISVTFGAGGSSNNNKTIEIAKKIKKPVQCGAGRTPYMSVL